MALKPYVPNVQPQLGNDQLYLQQELRKIADSVGSVMQSDSTKAPLASPVFTGTPTAPTAAAGNNSTQLATTAFVATSFAPLASPALTGTPTVPTATAGTNTTQAASTAFVGTAVSNAVTPINAAWTTYTPSLTAGTGTFTSASAAGRYHTIGKTVFVEIVVTITTNGTAAGSINPSLPVTAVTGGYCVLAGRERQTTGAMCQALVDSAATGIAIVKYDNTYPGADGYVIVVSGVYEAA